MKQKWPLLVYGALIGIALDFAAGYFLSAAFTNKPVEVFFYFGFAILILPLPLGAWKLAKKWIMFFLSGKEQLTRIALKEFYNAGFPYPYGEFGADDYLKSIAQNDSNAIKVRLSAENMLGKMEAARTIAPFSTGMMLTMATEEAMQRYKWPPHQRNAHPNEAAS